MLQVSQSSATNTLLAPTFIGAEVFGFAYLPHFFVVCAVAYLFNMDKSIQAAERQVSDIKKIASRQGLESLSPKLREVAMLRLENPDLGIEALGQLLSPPLSKSGVNNRLRRISDIAKGL